MITAAKSGWQQSIHFRLTLACPIECDRDWNCVVSVSCKGDVIWPRSSHNFVKRGLNNWEILEIVSSWSCLIISSKVVVGLWVKYIVEMLNLTVLQHCLAQCTSLVSFFTLRKNINYQKQRIEQAEVDRSRKHLWILEHCPCNCYSLFLASWKLNTCKWLSFRNYLAIRLRWSNDCTLGDNVIMPDQASRSYPVLVLTIGSGTTFTGVSRKSNDNHQELVAVW